MGLCCSGCAASPTFSYRDIPDLSSKVAIVTGASAGLGLVMARELARKGCHVIFACRSREKTMTVIHQLAKTLPGVPKLDFIHLDLMNLKSVAVFVDNFKARNLPLHILINNAGIMAPPFELSEDGIESHFATNHVGHHALTTGLLPILDASAPSRVVVVSSHAHIRAPWWDFDLEMINDETKYHAWRWYSQSKLANLLFTRELSRQLEVRNVHNVYVNAVHPGVVRTQVSTKHRHWLLNWLMALFEVDVNTAAKTLLYVATSDEIVTHNWHGEYFVPIARLGQSAFVDPGLGRRLWVLTESLIAESMYSESASETEICGTSPDEEDCPSTNLL
ncbi:hypothetical protein AeNC1_009150 [Aphanomyces euteiches]|nr:hypothetical protein AeNC1_009150 [Aphanomyces euteiches]